LRRFILDENFECEDAGIVRIFFAEEGFGFLRVEAGIGGDYHAFVAIVGWHFGGAARLGRWRGCGGLLRDR